jgi:molybdenum cofactor guanylyltransferase
MGTNKAFLKISGRSLLTNALELARSVTDDVRIVGDPAKFSAYGTVVRDIYPDRGPLGGIHAALEHSDTELNLIMGVDLPLLDKRFLTHLVGVSEKCDAQVVVCRVHGHYEPLCAVYRKPFAVVADTALAANRNKIEALFPEVSIRVIDDDELTVCGFSSAMFRNVNTPEDWKEAQEEFAARASHL